MTAYLFYDHWAACIFLIPLFGVYWNQWKADCIRKKEDKFLEQFREGILAVASALSTGYSVENAIREAWKDMQPMYRKRERILEEFGKMVHQLDVNMTAEEVMRQFAGRVKTEEVDNFVIVFVAAKRMGGDSIAIIRNAAKTISDKIEVEKEIRTMLAAKNFEFKIMCGIPFLIIFYMRISFPEFMEVLYRNLPGAVFMTICLGMYLAACYMGRKIIRIEV